MTIGFILRIRATKKTMSTTMPTTSIVFTTSATRTLKRNYLKQGVALVVVIFNLWRILDIALDVVMFPVAFHIHVNARNIENHIHIEEVS
jgi:hypothetical protein